MFKKKIELIKPIVYKDEATAPFFGQDNKLYRSLNHIFEAFVIFAKKELYLVGGCCRDMLLGKEPKDYDLCTNATPDEVKQICKAIGLKTFDSGIKHGTITIIDDFYKQSYELTSFRSDGKYTDGRHPDTVKFGVSLEEDLKRRDFTVNSFAYDLIRNELVMLDESYLKDLEFGIIRAVGDPAERYEEDALRMLRALRFSAQLNFSIEKYTYKAIEMCKALIEKVSKERVRDELTKIIMSDHPEVLEFVCVSGLEKYLFDGLTPFTDILNCEHQNPWHYTDVFHHTMDVINRTPKVFEVRFAAAFHDLGKPAVKELKEGTTDHYHYYGHQEVSADMALKLMDILKFSNDQKDLIYKFIKYHDDSLDKVKNATFKRVVNDIGKENFPLFMKLRLADAMSHRLSQDTVYAIDAVSKCYDRFADLIAKDEALTVKDLDINGYDLMDIGFQGKAIGDCLNYLLDIVLEDSALNNHDTLIELAKKFIENL